MKITKFVHSCLLVEMPAPVNRTALFDPGVFSEQAVDVDSLEFLDNIIITHKHPDHMSLPLIKRLVAKFPDAKITAPEDAAAELKAEGIPTISETSPGVEFFDSPHEDVNPVNQTPQQLGVHYLNVLTDPGDSHTFQQTKEILALPITAPWGAMVRAVNVALELQPKYIIPIHDWHWSDDARAQAYDMLEPLFEGQGITFIKPVTGEPFVLEV
jgi:L-ascorbate metabolism protein UlaG (beta-lactamase superfamily)